ncbi:MAG: hypothetical protein ACTHNG_04930 [Ginsengibacter sp.]
MLLMRRIIFLFGIIFFLAKESYSQSFVSFSSGISLDLNNKQPFYMVPLIFHWEPFKRSAIFVEYIKPLVFTKLRSADAFTTSAQLPEHVLLKEAINLKTHSIGAGGGLFIYKNKKGNIFTLNLSGGFCTEDFTVNYRNYDTKNYEVLNPEFEQYFDGLYAAAAGLYTFHNRIQFLMLRIQSNSSASDRFHYPHSFDITSPLQLTYGLNFNYNKK